ncbi:MAG TPA: SPFH domain-containing protein [Verrucomicrobiae bacterium]|nr:SPFH domain-containing protein [Verrucomicrobiae bacterium]
MNSNQAAANQERVVRVHNGWLMLPLLLALLVGTIASLVFSIVKVANLGPHFLPLLIGDAVLLLPTSIILLTGFFTLQPNEARVLILFGAYKGTVRESGFHWGNPFYSNDSAQSGLVAQMAEAQQKAAAAKMGVPGSSSTRKTCARHKISLRARTLNGEKLKVNDKRGNPIEIGAVVVWRVSDTAQATFDVDDYEKYVETQSESALRHLASIYAYDHGEENEVTLRSGVDEVSQALRKELQDRLAKAGVTVDETRLTHLAYAPEIAQAMLRRQQAEAVIDARQKIVHGAVSMVDMALRDLAEKHVVQLDDERRAAMVSNLMVVLCGEAEVHPVVNTGTLYT